MTVIPARRSDFPTPVAEVRIVHSSDVHVAETVVEAVHDGDGTAGLRVVLAAARGLGADVVVLAGDTFENNRLPLDLLDRAKGLLAAAGMPVVILPGNHDPAITESAFTRGGIADLPHVHVLGVTHDEAVPFPALGLEIWGRAHRDYDDMAPLIRSRPRSSFWQIAMAHGHYEPSPNRDTPLRPGWLIGDAELEATGADYVALGHWNRHIRVGNGDIAAYYSGSPDLAGTVNLVRLTAEGAVVVTREPVDWGRP